MIPKRKLLSSRAMRDRKQASSTIYEELRYECSAYEKCFHVTDAKVFRDGDLVRLGDSEEVIFVESASRITDRLWVVRGYGGTRPSYAKEGSEIRIIGNAAFVDRINSHSPCVSAGAGSDERAGAPGSASIADAPPPKASDAIRVAMVVEHLRAAIDEMKQTDCTVADFARALATSGIDWRTAAFAKNMLRELGDELNTLYHRGVPEQPMDDAIAILGNTGFETRIGGNPCQ